MNQRAQPVYTVIVPCYNEGARLRSDQFHHFLEEHPEIRILFVNDGSKDQTLAVLGEARRGFEDRIEILDKQRNFGKAEAIRCGSQLRLWRHPIRSLDSAQLIVGCR